MGTSEKLVAIGFLGMAIPSLVLVMFLVFYAGSVSNKSREYQRQPVAIKTNDIGCIKYRFKDSFYWECPKELNISSIEKMERNVKTTNIVLEPVVSVEE